MTPVRPDDDFIKAYENTIARQNRYFLEVIEERRREPQDDLVSRLVQATPNDRALMDDELCGIMGLLVSSGFTTSVQMLSHAVLLLAKSPQLMMQLAANPALIPAFIEELLRFNPSVLATLRITTQPVTISGVEIPKGELVLPLVASANRDPEQFPDPESFILSRAGVKHHLAFGYGIHTCVGAALARLELKIALETLLAAYTHLSCPEGKQLDWKRTIFVRSISRLPVRFY